MSVLLFRPTVLRLCLLILPGLLLAVASAFAQTPGKDCINAIPICGNSFTQSAPSLGEGVDTLEINPATSCLFNGEENGYWYVFSIDTAGSPAPATPVAVTIIPDDLTDNFDFVIYEQGSFACDEVLSNTSAQISCNFSETPGITGATGANTQTTGGPFDPPENNTIFPTYGTDYLIYVSNPDSSFNNYTINVSPLDVDPGTVPAALDGFVDNPECGDLEVDVRFTKNVACGSLDPNDFQVVTATDTLFGVGLESAACTVDPTDGHSPVYTLTLNAPLQGVGPGELIVNGSQITPCGANGVADTLDFTLDAPPTLDIIAVSPATCGDNVVEFVLNQRVDCSSIDVGDFTLTDTSGNTLPVQALQSSSCLGGEVGGDTLEMLLTQGITSIGVDYTITYNGGIVDLCGDSVNTAIDITFQIVDTLALDLGPDTSVCAYDPVIQLNADITGGPNARIAWLPNVGLNDASLPNPVATVTAPRTYTARVFNNNCFSNSDTISIDLISTPNFSAVGDLNICPDTAGTIFLAGAQRFLWLVDSVEASVRTLSPSVTTTYDIVPFNEQCGRDTFQVTMNVVETPDGSIVAPDTVCTGAIDTIGFNGTFLATDNFTWDFDGGNGTSSGSQFAPYEVTWATPGIKRIVLTTSTFGCIDTFQRDIRAIQQPIVNAGSDVTVCGQQPTQLNATAIFSATNCEFRWLSPGGLPNIPNPLVSPATTTDYVVQLECGRCVSAPDTVRVNVLPRPLATVASNTIVACEGQPRQIQASASGGVGALAYNWTPATGLNNSTLLSPTANPSDTTLYTLIVTDSNGCQSDPVQVNYVVNPLPLANAGPDQSFCEGLPGVNLQGSVLNAAGGNFSYQWLPTTGLTDPTDLNTFAQPATTTDYSLIVTNLATGCSSEGAGLDTNAITTVFVTPRPVANAGPDRTICIGDTMQAGLPPQGTGGPNWSFDWTPFNGIDDPNANQPTFSPVFTTQYYFTVTSGDGCESLPDTLNVTVLPRPNVNITTPDTGVCPGGGILLEVDVNAASAIQGYQWTPAELVENDTLPSTLAFPETTTTFFVGVETENCVLPTFDSLEVEVREAPVVDVIPGAEDDVTICPDESFTIPATVTAPGPFTFEWTPDDGFISNVNVLQPTVNPPSTENYILTAVYNGCTTRDTAQIFVAAGVEALAEVDTNAVCEGQPVTLTSLTEQPVNLQWLPADQVLNPTDSVTLGYPNASLVYQLVAERDGCTDTINLPVTVFTQPEAGFDFTVTNTCEEGEVQFYSTSQEAAAYFWDFGDGNTSNAANPVHDFPAAGEYTVRLRVVAEGTCDDEAVAEQTVRVAPRAQLDFVATPEAPDTLLMPNATLNLTSTGEGVASWFWRFGDSRTAYDSSLTHTYERAGEYTVRLTVIDSAGCSADTIIGTYTVLEQEVQVPNVFTPNGDMINDTWSPGYNGNDDYEVHVFGRNGRQWFSSTRPNEVWDPRDEAPAGVYLYTLTIGRRNYKGSFTLLR